MLGWKPRLMSKEHRPGHKDPYTGLPLGNREQVCKACGYFFGTIEAGDAHRVGIFGVNRRCIHPNEAGLVAVHNRFGTVIWVVDDGD